MYFPKFWFRADAEAGYATSGRSRFSAWGWSDVSGADALEHAKRRLADAARAAGDLSRPTQDWYYQSTPLREPVLELVASGQDGPEALITRNRFGALVLNTASLFIADVDVPAWEGSDGLEVDRSGTGLFRRFGRRKRDDVGQTPGPQVPSGWFPASGATRPINAAELGAATNVVDFAARHPTAGVRLYRTAAGLRVIVTTDGMEISTPAGGDHSMRMLAELGSDQRYVDLSRVYGSYRARLTPKPWRCGGRKPVRHTPGDTELTDRDFDVDPQWVQQYQHLSQGYATCRLLMTAGPPPSAREGQILTVHDRHCRTDAPLLSRVK